MSICPSVSVIIPAFNAEECLKRAVSSVLCQDYRGKIEIIIIDDCSTDSTAKIAKSLSMENDNIKVISLVENCGVAEARNKGVGACRGEFVAFLDCDDEWTTSKLSSQIALQLETGADAVYCSYTLVDDKNGHVLGEYEVPKHIDFEGLLKENYVGCSTVLIKREAVLTHPFSNDFYHEDYALWLTLLKEGYLFCGCRESLVNYMVSKKSRSADKLRSARNRWKIYRNMLGLSLKKSIFCMVFYTFAGLKKHLHSR